MSDEVLIERLGAQGDGQVAGRPLFVPYSLPGERIRVTGTGDRVQPVEILEAAPERISPICPHYGTCGGCALQHAADAFVATWKRERVVEALAARGIEGVEIRPTLTSPPGSRRRVTLSARKLRNGTLAGFHARGDGAIVPVARCPVAHPSLIAVLPDLGELIERMASRSGELRLTLTWSEAGIDLAVDGGKALDRPAQALLAGAATRAGLARLGAEGEEIVTLRPPTQRIGRATVLPPPGAFLQPTRQGEAALLQAVREICGDAGQIADLFAGIGTFALPLAETAAVLAVEQSQAALAALDAGWRQAEGLKMVETEARDLMRRALLARELKGFEAVVIDPPRAGARAQAEQLAASDVPVVASVSCNPATFARDARILLDGGYRLDWIQPIDQFRWSPHVELVAAFRRDT